MTTTTGTQASATFYLGTHEPGWLWSGKAPFPLFVAAPRLARYANLHPATTDWALDSGGFTALSKRGRWTVSALDYVRQVARYQREIGRMMWAAPQDWMCEPGVISGGMVGKVRCVGTGLTVKGHQWRTVANFRQLVRLWPSVSDAPCPFIPVLQGWTLADYERCEAMYQAAGVDLTSYPVVGIGSVCRRQGTEEIGRLVATLGQRYPLHGFGVKTLGLASYGEHLASADSLAWSYAARRSAPIAGHTHKSCSNCLPYATAWRARVLSVTCLT
jgi:hypothetical protein